jgi:hypothetical protein
VKFKKKSADAIENVLLRVLHMCFDGAYVLMWKNFDVRYTRFILFILAAYFL